MMKLMASSPHAGSACPDRSGDGVVVHAVGATPPLHPRRGPPGAVPHPAADAPGHPGRRRDGGHRIVPPRRVALCRALLHFQGRRRPRHADALLLRRPEHATPPFSSFHANPATALALPTTPSFRGQAVPGKATQHARGSASPPAGGRGSAAVALPGAGEGVATSPPWSVR
ncbi:hypothetical protein U9M48_010436, partial [Paspalum notatum var. saurae]